MGYVGEERGVEWWMEGVTSELGMYCVWRTCGEVGEGKEERKERGGGRSCVPLTFQRLKKERGKKIKTRL